MRLPSSYPKRPFVVPFATAVMLVTGGIVVVVGFHQPYSVLADTGFTDFNGDGYADLAIGVPGETVSGKPNAGAVNIIYGSSIGLSATKSRPDQILTQDSSGINDSAEGHESFGWAVASGDFNNDGYTDLAVGAPRETVSGKRLAGAVNVIYGSSTGLRSTPADDGTGREDQFWHQDSVDVAGAAENSDSFGWTLIEVILMAIVMAI